MKQRAVHGVARVVETPPPEPKGLKAVDKLLSQEVCTSSAGIEGLHKSYVPTTTHVCTCHQHVITLIPGSVGRA